jgi:hypothetical protein
MCGEYGKNCGLELSGSLILIEENKNETCNAVLPAPRRKNVDDSPH